MAVQFRMHAGSGHLKTIADGEQQLLLVRHILGVYMGASGPVFAVEGAVSADVLDYRAFLYSGSSFTQADIGGNVQVRIIGVTADQRILIDENASVIYQSGQVTGLGHAQGSHPKGSTISTIGTVYGGGLILSDFQVQAQLWNADGQMLVTDFGSSTYSFVRFTRLSETANGLVGTAEAYDSEGSFGEILIAATPIQNGFAISTLSDLYPDDSVHAATRIGSSVYYVTDDPGIANDAVIRVVGSTETIEISSLLPSADGVLDTVVNELAYDSANDLWYVQGYYEKAGSRESWLFAITVTPEVPAKPTPNFQHLPFQTNSQSAVSWDAIDGAASYVVQINDLTRNLIERKVTSNTNQLDVTLANSGQYAIWVQAVGATGKPSPWSDRTTFSVVNQPPAISYSSGTFTWTNLGAALYRLWVNNSQGQKVIDQSTSAVEFVQSLPAGSYTAWVKPDSSSWSSPYRFTVFHDGVTVNPLTTLDATPTVSWTGAADGTYDVFVALRNAPATAVYRQTVSGNSVTLSPRARGVYSVWVRQLFPDGTVSRWGSGATLEIADRPVLALAGNILSWTSYAGAAQYELWVSTSTTTDRIAVSPTFVSGTSLNLSTLTELSSGNYRVWIRAVSDGSPGMFGVSLWGNARAFTV